MDAETRPYVGLLQSQSGPKFSLTWPDVKRNSKSNLPPAGIRWILAQNVATLRDKKFAQLPNATRRNEALAMLIPPTSKSQIQRIVARQLGPSIDLIERLAGALDVRPQDLLTPYFANTVAAKPPREIEGKGELQRRPGRPVAVPSDT